MEKIVNNSARLSAIAGMIMLIGGILVGGILSGISIIYLFYGVLAGFVGSTLFFSLSFICTKLEEANEQRRKLLESKGINL